MKTEREKHLRRLTKTLERSKNYVEFERAVMRSPHWHLSSPFWNWTKKDLQQFYNLIKGARI